MNMTTAAICPSCGQTITTWPASLLEISIRGRKYKIVERTETEKRILVDDGYVLMCRPIPLLIVAPEGE